jgi:hypothetical protein
MAYFFKDSFFRISNESSTTHDIQSALLAGAEVIGLPLSLSHTHTV